MPTTWMKNPSVSIAGVDLSASVRKVGVTRSYAKKDGTVGNAQGAEESTLTLESGAVMILFKQDFDAAAVNDTLEAIGRDEVAVDIAREQGAASATNKHWTSARAILPEFTPFDTTIGDIIDASVTLDINGGWVIDDGVV